jgi:hypothetical protein
MNVTRVMREHVFQRRVMSYAPRPQVLVLAMCGKAFPQSVKDAPQGGCGWTRPPPGAFESAT